MYGFWNSVATFKRRSSNIYSGSIPITSSISISFDATAQIQATVDTSVGVTLTVLGNTAYSKYFAAGKTTEVFGSFTSVTDIYTSIPSAQGFLDVSLVRDTGEGIESIHDIETREVMFQKTGRNVYFKNIGRVEMSDATLYVENLTENITEQDLVWLNPPGLTYNIIGVSTITNIVGRQLTRCDLVIPQGAAFREFK